MKFNPAKICQSLSVEATRVSAAWLQFVYFRLPFNLTAAMLKDPAFGKLLDREKLRDAFSDAALGLFDALGPMYGKMGQMTLSRLNPAWHQRAEDLRLTRLYDEWPPISRDEIEFILDDQIPAWRSELTLSPVPLGVASMAQVHSAVDGKGREWVVKVLKPQAKKRLTESIKALESFVSLAEPVAISLTTRRVLRELKELCQHFRMEMDLEQERKAVLRAKEALEKRGGQAAGLLKIPDCHETLHAPGVIVVSRFRGISLADVISGRAKITLTQRKRLARKMLKELLIQVFEIGLFHADPHAGNLILLEDGSVGLFDWGLFGELLESDRKHIAALLRSVISLDMERLVDALMAMAEDAKVDVTRAQVVKEVAKVSASVKKRAKGAKKDAADQDEGDTVGGLDLRGFLEASLRGAEKLKIPVPQGLLMMAKSLMTIEGLARGIDPDISMLRIATPIIWRAAKPGLTDFVSMIRKLPTLLKTF